MRLPYRNLVTVPSIRKWVIDEFCPQLETTREDRVTQEERWMAYHRQYNVELDESYMGRSRVYIAATRNVIQTWQTALKGGCFPPGEQLDVKATHGFGLDANAQAQKALQKQMFRNMKIKEQFDEFTQQYCTFGNGVFNHGWEDEEEMQRFYERVQAGMPLDEDSTLIYEDDTYDEDEDALSFRSSQGYKHRLVERMVKTRFGPFVRPVDIFHLHASPSTARSLQEAELVFEDMTVALTHLEDMHDQWMDPKHHKFGHIYDMIDEILATDGGRLPIAVQDTDERRRIREGQEQDPNVLFGDLDEGFVNLSNCFWRGEIPGAKDPDTKKAYGVRDWQITVVNDKYPVRIHPNPRYRNRRPWHLARMIRVVNELLGRGVVEPIASVQLMLNDIGNMTMDNMILALNPIALVDYEKVQNFDSLQMSPAAKWFVEHDGVEFVNPPNVVQLGSATLNMMIGFIQDGGRANFATQGTPAPQGRGRAQNTATGISIMASTGTQGFNAALEDIQDQVFIPAMESNYEMQEQFMSDQMLIQLGGSDGIPLLTRPVRFEDVVGDYIFTWKAAAKVREQGQMIQGMQGLMQTLSQIKQVDPEFAATVKIKWAPWLKRLIQDGYGLAWADEVIETPEDQRVIDPYLELDLMAEGRGVPVSPADDDQQHLMVQLPAATSDPRFNDPAAMQLLTEHVQAHMAQMQMKQQAQQAAAMAQAAAMMGQGPGAGGPAGMPSPTGMGGGGNPTQAAAAGLAAGAQPGGMG